MPFVYPYQEEERKEFTFKECRDLGLKCWQCPPFQFGVVAVILLILVLIVASRVILDIKTTLLILFIFGILMIISAYIIVRNYNKKFK